MCSLFPNQGTPAEAQEIRLAFQQGEHEPGIWRPNDGKPPPVQVRGLQDRLPNPRPPGQTPALKDAHNEAGMPGEAPVRNVRRDRAVGGQLERHRHLRLPKLANELTGNGAPIAG